tara:strand:- start:704 stop:1030 length:327 start_codon:yes stop_codon:yes gene_type:complete
VDFVDFPLARTLSSVTSAAASSIFRFLFSKSDCGVDVEVEIGVEVEIEVEIEGEFEVEVEVGAELELELELELKSVIELARGELEDEDVEGSIFILFASERALKKNIY